MFQYVDTISVNNCIIDKGPLRPDEYRL